MKKFFLVALVLAFVSMLIPFSVNQNEVKAETQPEWTYVDSFEALEYIQNDEEALNSVEELRILPTAYSMSHVPYIQYHLDLIKKCRNLKGLYFDIPGLKIDGEFINDMPSLEWLWLQGCDVDFEGVKSSKLDILRIDICNVKNLNSIVGFTNLSMLITYYVDDVEYVDLEKFKKLEYVRLAAASVDDYEALFNKIKNVKTLQLDYSNITNRDTVYLKKLKYVEDLRLVGTLIDDISFLKEMQKLTHVDLPYGVKDLSVLYKLKSLKSVYMDGFTLMNVTQELFTFLDKNHIEYAQYDSWIIHQVDGIMKGFNFTDSTSDFEKIDVITNFVTKQISYDMQGAMGGLFTTLYLGMGVCNDYSLLEYTLLKCAGLDAYFVVGVGKVGGEYLSHAWNEVCVDDVWYTIDSTWLDNANEYDYQAYYMSKPTTEISWDEYASDTDKYVGELFALTHLTLCDPMQIVEKQNDSHNVYDVLDDENNQVVDVDLNDELTQDQENIIDESYSSPNLSDAKESKPAQFNGGNIFYWALGGACFGLVVFVISRIVRKKKS